MHKYGDKRRRARGYQMTRVSQQFHRGSKPPGDRRPSAREVRTRMMNQLPNANDLTQEKIHLCLNLSKILSASFEKAVF